MKSESKGVRGYAGTEQRKKEEGRKAAKTGTKNMVKPLYQKQSEDRKQEAKRTQKWRIRVILMAKTGETRTSYSLLEINMN